jgi:hypothetical protein
MQKKVEIGKKNIRKMKKMRKNEIKQIIKGESVQLKRENDQKDAVIVVAASLFVIFFIIAAGLAVDKFVWGWI